MTIKVFALLSLSFWYLTAAKKINYWYLLLLLSSIASDTFLIFEDSFLIIGVLLLLLNRFLYIIISRRALKETDIKTLLLYLVPSLGMFIIFYVLMKPFLEEISSSFLLLGLTSATMILFSFLNYLNKMNTKNKYFLLGILLIVVADILIAYNKYLDYQLFYVIVYTTIYYVARYLICRAMILEKN
ncbi:lysoplasmalogenase family protein [uncultured Tenacibaculum sp.]|uniref:lysoplasmalogenase family protein n=1 Tax=uncultured Tenacibaculum sp. TaxID=174713 RepID=UPI0026318C2D|nr:lysoplasmalogenase family protein [uncultured Tenacibaculum sp.]